MYYLDFTERPHAITNMEFLDALKRCELAGPPRLEKWIGDQAQSRGCSFASAFRESFHAAINLWQTSLRGAAESPYPDKTSQAHKRANEALTVVMELLDSDLGSATPILAPSEFQRFIDAAMKWASCCKSEDQSQLRKAETDIAVKIVKQYPQHVFAMLSEQIGFRSRHMNGSEECASFRDKIVGSLNEIWPREILTILGLPDGYHTLSHQCSSAAMNYMFGSKSTMWRNQQREEFIARLHAANVSSEVQLNVAAFTEEWLQHVVEDTELLQEIWKALTSRSLNIHFIGRFDVIRTTLGCTEAKFVVPDWWLAGLKDLGISTE